MPSGVYKRTQEHCNNISKRLMGRPGPWKGKKLSKKHCNAISSGNKNKKRTKEMKKKYSLSKMGSKNPMSKSNPNSIEPRERMSKTLTKEFNDCTHISKHRKIRKKYGKANHCELNKGHKSSVFNWANINHKYNENMNEWIQLCRRCHILFDRRKINIKVIKQIIKSRKII